MAYAYVPTGHFTPPIYDGGIPDIPAAFLDLAFQGRFIGSNNITALYGLDGASPVTTLGIIGSINQAIKFGSPYGIQGYTIQPSFILSNSNVSGTTPVFNKAILHYLKDPDRRQSFDFTIDLKETARSIGLPVDAVLGTLSSIMNSKVLVPFWYGLVGTRSVKILDIPSEVKTGEDLVMSGEREGLVRLRVSEII